MKWSVEEMIRIAEAGGGMPLQAREFRVEDLVAVAAAAAPLRARLIITHSHILTTEQVIAIASAGKGCVFFE